MAEFDMHTNIRQVDKLIENIRQRQLPKNLSSQIKFALDKTQEIVLHIKDNFSEYLSPEQKTSIDAVLNNPIIGTINHILFTLNTENKSFYTDSSIGSWIQALYKAIMMLS